MDAPNDPPAFAGGIRETISAPVRRDQPQPLSPVVAPSDGHDGVGQTPARPTWQAELGRRLRRRPGRAVLAGLVLGSMFGLLSGELMVQGPTTWTSQTVLLFDDPLGIAVAGDPGQLAKLIELRYKYASLAETEAIAAPVAAELHVPVSEVLGSASVTVPPNSVLFDVLGTWSNPSFASAVSRATAQEVMRYVQAENATFSVPSANQFTVSVVSSTSQAVRSSPSKTRAIGVGLIVFLGAFLVGFTAYQLSVRPRRRTPS